MCCQTGFPNDLVQCWHQPRQGSRAGRKGAPGIGGTEASHRLPLCVSLWGPEWKSVRMPDSFPTSWKVLGLCLRIVIPLYHTAFRSDGCKPAILLVQHKMIFNHSQSILSPRQSTPNSEHTAGRQTLLPWNQVTPCQPQ